MGNDERRSYGRGRSQLMSCVTFPDTGKVIRVLTHDISGAGIRFTTDQALEPDTALQMELQWPDGGAPIRFMAQVVWSRFLEGSQADREVRAEVGVRFLDIAPKDLTLILHYARLNALGG